MHFLLGVATLVVSIGTLNAVLITCDDVTCPGDGTCQVDNGVAYCAGCDKDCAASCDGVTCPQNSTCKQTGSVVHCVGCPGIPPGHCRPLDCTPETCGGDTCKITGAVAHCKCRGSGPPCKTMCQMGANAPDDACHPRGVCNSNDDIAFCDVDGVQNGSLTCDYVKCTNMGVCRERDSIATCECTDCDVACNPDKTCKNGGVCEKLDGNAAICKCPGDSTDPVCQNMCHDVVCPTGCTCRPTGTVVHCDCDGLHGRETFAKCKKETCENTGGDCRETGSVVHCVGGSDCQPEATGDYGCEEEEPECAGPCLNGGQYFCECKCPDGYDGKWCQDAVPVEEEEEEVPAISNF